MDMRCQSGGRVHKILGPPRTDMTGDRAGPSAEITNISGQAHASRMSIVRAIFQMEEPIPLREVFLLSHYRLLPNN